MLAPALFALFSAFWFGAAAIFLRRAMKTVAPPTAAIVSVTCTAVFVWLVTLVTVPVGRIVAPAMGWFLLAGLFAPGLARLGYYLGLARVGVGRASSLIATAPVFAVAFAAVALGERPRPTALLGVVGIVSGAALLARRGGADVGRWRRRDLLLPALGAVGFALRDVVSRHGLVGYPEPMVAAAGATLASVVLMWALAAGNLVPFTPPSRAGLFWVVVSGFCESLAYLTMWRAFAVAPVAFVSPLVNSQPLFALLLTAVFLRDVERVTWRITVAALLIVGGVAGVLRFT